jgi:hypothetical protein
MRSSSENVRLCRFCKQNVISHNRQNVVKSINVTYSAGISQKVRANRLNVAVICRAELPDGLEVLLASPTSRKDWQR